MSDHVSTRVNGARLGAYQSRTIRIVGKILRYEGDTALMEACDGGQVSIRIPRGQEGVITDTFVEIIGTAQDASSVKMMACTNMGSNLDLKMINDVIELSHDPKFAGRMF
ncbi:replication factor A protein 3 [Dentipellis sp. KUC8613]|nr:replication factor A protein 3 [Dentipellis sp. KUC8613]